jgi:hypothetical protein
MKTITLTAFKRLDCLIQLLKSLEANDLTGYSKLYCAVEPVDVNIVERLKKVKFIDVDITVNKTILGVRQNPFNILTKAFNEGSDYNVYLEDDMILSPDAFDFFNYYHDNLHTQDRLCACAYNYNSDPAYNNLVTLSNDFVALGVGIFKNHWNDYFKPYWFNEQFRKDMEIDMGGIGGWDWCIRAVMKKFNMTTIMPTYSRSYHTGKFGVHCTPKCYDTMFKNHPYCKERIGGFHADFGNSSK